MLGEKEYRAVLESIDEGFYVIDIIFDENGRPVDMFYVASNPAANRMVGSDFTGRRLRDIAPYEEYWYEIFGKVARTGESARMERYAEPDKKWFSFFVFKIGDAKSRRIGTIFQDITERKRAEAVLREVNEKLEERVEERIRMLEESEERQWFLLHLSDALRSLTNDKDILLTASCLFGEYLNADRAFFGELYQEKNLAIMHPDYARGGLPSLAGRFKISDFQETVDALEGGRPYVINDVAISEVLSEHTRSAYLALSYASFFSVPLFKQGRLVLDLSAVSSEARDWSEDEIHLAQEVAERTWVIVERARAVEALRESREELNRAQEVARTGSWRLRLPSEELLWSDAEYRIFGVPIGMPMTYRKFLETVYPDDRKYVDRKWAAGMRGEPYDVEHRIMVDGRIRWVRERAVLEVVDGVLKAGFGTTQDITEKKQAEEELRRSNAELQQFAYVASHDMREPLRMVTSYLDLYNKKYGDKLDSKGKEYIAFALDGADRMRELIDDLLALSRVDSRPMKFEELDLNEVVGEVLGDLHVAIGDAKAEVMVAPLPVVVADEMNIKQVFLNLISNAIKFHDGSTPRIEVLAQRSGSDWEIAVRDNGIGIEPEYHRRIFEMFQRLHTKEEYPGTGIGLAIAKKIVEMQGGRIWVESMPGKGSTFFFTIPNLAYRKGMDAK